MMKLKAKAEPEPTLLERIKAFRSEVDSFIDEKAAELHRTRDGSGLPIFQLRHMLVRGNHSCPCRGAALILGHDLDG